MKKGSIRIFPLLLALVLCLGMAACGGQPAASTAGAGSTPPPAADSGDTADEQGTWESDTSPITLDVYVNASWFDIEWLTDVSTRTSAYITAKTGVTVNFIVPTGDEAEKMNTMIASNSVPDLVLADNYSPQTQSLIEAGLCLPLTDLADRYDESFYDIVTPSQIEWFRAADGNLYDYPNYSHSYDVASEKLASGDESFLMDIASDTCVLARKDIYEAIGSPDMTTPEGFLDALVKAKEMYPTVDGKPLYLIDFHLFSESANHGVDYIKELAGIPDYNEDGTLYDYISDPEYIRWLKVYREAYEMGLFSKDVFVDDVGQIQEKQRNGQYFLSYSGRSHWQSINSTLYYDMGGADTGIYYIPIDTMRNSAGDNPKINGKLLLDGWMNTYITTNCKDPARAIRFLNYINGPEGQHDLFFGEEGVTFDYVDGVETFKPFILDGSLTQEELDKNYFVRTSNWAWCNYNIQPDFAKTIELPFDPDTTVREWVVDYLYLAPEVFTLTLEGGSDAAVADSKIKYEWYTTVVQLMTAESEAAFDALYEEFLAKRDGMDFEMVQQAFLEVAQGRKAKLE